jgi:hypothetical protein
VPSTDCSKSGRRAAFGRFSQNGRFVQKELKTPAPRVWSGRVRGFLEAFFRAYLGIGRAVNFVTDVAPDGQAQLQDLLRARDGDLQPAFAAVRLRG